VDVQQEQLQFSNNAARYEATMRFLDGKIKSLEKAISGK
jgi:flagellar basal body rod protein FlgB